MNIANPLCFINRVGALRNGASSGSHIIIDSYDSEAEEYRVKFLGTFDGSTHSVKPCDIEIQTTASAFLDRFSNPPHFFIRGKLDMKNIPTGSIVDFSECTEDPIVESGKLFVRGSYRFVGKKCVSEDGSITRTRLPYCVYVGAQNDSDIIEFENIEFDQNQSCHNVLCLRGMITFDNCCFLGVANGLKLGSGNAPVQVTLQTCVITSGSGCGVLVENNASVAIVNCEIGGDGIGVSVKEGGTCKALYSLFYDSIFGAVLGGAGKTSALYLSSCKLQRHKRCSVLAFDGTLSINKTTICDSLGTGIWLTCAVSTGLDAQIGTSVIHNCGCGLKIGQLSSFHCTTSILSECDVGLFVTPAGDGVLAFDDLTNNTSAINTANFRGLDSQFYLDYELQPPCQKESIQAVNNLLSRASPTEQQILGKILSSELSLKAKRFIAKSDIQTHVSFKPSCEACDKPESEPNTFLNCARCKQICYCSKECQVGHWATHRLTCKLSNGWKKEMVNIGYGECCMCHTVMQHDDEKDPYMGILNYCKSCYSNALQSK